MDSIATIKQELLQASDVLDSFMQDVENIKKVEKAAKLLSEAFDKGGKVISCGNGGSLRCYALCRRAYRKV